MDFITLDDCATDNILTCEASDVTYANSYLQKMAEGFGLSADEVAIPCSVIVKQLGVTIAYKVRALAMVGSDATATASGNRAEDIYLQKYKLFDETARRIESQLDFSDFAVDGTSSAGKGGVGIIRLSRA